MISLTIDNQKIEAREGTKILEAALESGINIPHMCYHPKLTPFGGCRLCLVEVEGEGQLAASCVTPVAEGMQVHTANDRIIRARRTIVQLLLLNHPLDCLVCDRGGHCLLQKLAFELNIQPGKYNMKKRVLKGVQRRALMEVDLRKCMHCGLCVRACKELRYLGAIDFYHRGFKTEIGVPFADEAHCELCGQCVEVCPVAGVVEMESKYVARPWELRQVQTVCPFCGTGCLITLNTKQNRVIKISAEDESGINEGKICVKGRFGCSFINSSDRLTSPLIKKDGQFQPVSWEEALKYTADKLKAIIAADGSQVIGGQGSVKCPNEDNYLFQKFMRAAVGTNNIDNYTRMEHSPTLSGFPDTLDIVTANNSLDQIGSAELIFIIGASPSNSHPIVGLNVRKAVKAGHRKLIVADPRKIKLAVLADQWIQLKPGTDLALLCCIMHIILKESPEEDLAKIFNISGFEAFRHSLAEYHADRVSKVTGVPEEDIRKAARAIADAKSIAIIYSSGITQHVWGTQNVTALADLFLLTGHAAQEDSGIYPLRDDSNSQGACDMGVLPDYFPGYQPVDDYQVRQKFEKAWGKELPSTPGLTSTEMIGAIRNGKLKALYVMGDNPIRHYPNSRNIKSVLDSLDFLVVQDLFLSETAKLADVVLPATSFAEREGTFTNMDRRVQKITQGIVPPGEVLQDWEIICRISAQIGYPMNYSSVSEIMDEINTLVPIYGGITHQRLESGSLYWPCPGKDHPGTKFLPVDGEKNDKVRFAPLPPIPVLEEVDQDYPYKLIFGGTLYHSGGGTLSMRSKALKSICPDGYVDLNPQDAAKLGISANDTIRISSVCASVEAKARLLPQNPEGIVFMPVEFEELHVQELLCERFDPVSHIPAMKVCSVSLGKV